MLVSDGLQFLVFHKLLMDWDFFFSISGDRRRWFRKEEITKELQLCGERAIVDVRGLNGRLAGKQPTDISTDISSFLWKPWRRFQV